MLACDRAFNDTGLNPKIREQIRMAAHHSDHPCLAALFVQCERAIEHQPDAMQAFMASRVSGPPPSTVPSAAVFVNRYFPVESPLLTASALAVLTTFTLPSIDVFNLYFCEFNGCLPFLCSYLLSLFQIFFYISVSFKFVSSAMVLPYSRGRRGKFALTVTGPSYVPYLDTSL